MMLLYACAVIAGVAKYMGASPQTGHRPGYGIFLERGGSADRRYLRIGSSAWYPTRDNSNLVLRKENVTSFL
jgi:hypothetical protein